MREEEISAPESDYRVLCIGRMVLDIVAKPVERLPYEEEAVEIEVSEICHGGSAANTAAELCRLGMTAYICGLLGNDSLGYKLRDTLRSQGINTEKIIFEEGETSSFCFVPIGSMGQPRYLYYLGNDSRISYDVLTQQLGIVDYVRTELITHVHIAGINLLPLLDGEPLAKLLEGIKRTCGHVTVSVDTSKVLTNAKSNLKALNHIDMFLCNEREGQAIADSTQLLDIAHTIAPADGTGAKVCIVKLGERGAAAHHYLHESPMICPTYRVKVQNLNGAGDAFTAKLLAAFFGIGKLIDDLTEDEVYHIVDEANRAAAAFVGMPLGARDRRRPVPPEAKRPTWSGPLDLRRPDRLIFDSQAHVANFERHRQISEPTMNHWIAELDSLLERTGMESVSVLDVGCGTGRFALPLATRTTHPGLTVSAIDSSPSMVRVLQSKAESQGIGNIVVRQRDFYSLETDDKHDLVLLSEVIHLMWDIDSLFRKVADHLKPSGMVALRAPSHAQLERIEWYGYFPGTLEIDLRRHRDIDYLYSALYRCGFERIEVQEIDETKVMPGTEYVAALEAKAYSTLHLVDGDFFEDHLARMKEKLSHRKRVTRSTRIMRHEAAA